jgi:hypothetical protein
MGRRAKDGKPVIGASEVKDSHNKVYTEASMTAAIKDFQHREGYASFSEAGRALWLIAFSHPAVFGGYSIK